MKIESGISVGDIAEVVLSDNAESEIAFLRNIQASSASAKIDYSAGTLKDFYFQVSISSLSDLLSNLGGDVLPSGSLSVALSAAKLDSFDLTDVVLRFARTDGVYSLQVHAIPVLEALGGVTSSVDILAENLASRDLRVALAFSVSTFQRTPEFNLP